MIPLTSEQLALVAADFRERGWSLRSWSIPGDWVADLIEEGGITYADVPAGRVLAGLPVYLRTEGDAVLFGFKPDGRGEYGIVARTSKVL